MASVRRDPPLRPPKRVLDLGSDTGDHSRLFAAQGYDAVGVDAPTGTLEKARTAGGDVRDVGPFLLQIINYDRIEIKKEHAERRQ